MIYPKIISATFLSRPNRFIAHVDIDGKTEIAHVKNTGRCKELLVPGATVYLALSDNSERKTKYDLVSVQKGKRLINMDSQAPNRVFYEYLELGRYISGVTKIKPEAKFGNSRFDFYVETESRKIFIEVKGVTLEESGVVLFPDAPTERGVKHLNELVRCLHEGYEAQVVFVIQMDDVRYFTPNDKTHPEFGKALRKAEKEGAAIVALDCAVAPDNLNIGKTVQIRL